MSEDRRLVLMGVVLAVLLAACGTPPASSQQEGAPGPEGSFGAESTAAPTQPETAESPEQVDTGGAHGSSTPGSTPSETLDQRETESEAPQEQGSPASSPSPEPPPRQDKLREDTTVPVTAVVRPECVVRGTAATLEVNTNPEASIAWHARYAGNEGGAEPPFGEGHGGDGSGKADASGHYRSQWTVSPDAPTGPARVDVVVGWEGEWGFDDPVFHVVDEATDC